MLSAWLTTNILLDSYLKAFTISAMKRMLFVSWRFEL